jgi:predicted dehydrogenase
MLRIGVVGIGNMGRAHAQYLAAGQIEGAALTAVCDIAPAALEWARTQLGS